MSRKQGGFWSNLLGYQPPREKFSLEELQHLHDILRSNSVVTDHNRDRVVEALRAIAELMIWGDQHDPRFFEFFLENNLMRHFSQFLDKPSNRRGDVAKQVLQTIYILIQNIRSETAIYYIFSNNHVNDIVTLSFDFEDDEVLGYYINVLKTISLRLTSKSVQFFVQQDGEVTAFPLYTEAVKFINHRDGMVRAAVRTLTLNVYSIEDAAVRQFLVSKPASNYFNDLSLMIAEQCQMLDRKLSTLEAGTSSAAFSVETALADIEDAITYCNDILCTGDVQLSRLLMQCLWECFIWPVLINPLRHLATPTSNGSLPFGALCILERLLHILNHSKLADRIAAALVLQHQEPEGLEEATAVPLESQGGCRRGFLEALRCGDTVVAAAAVRVVLALIQNRAIDPEILDASGLLPQRRKENKQLLDMLTADGEAAGTQPAKNDLFGDLRVEESRAPESPLLGRLRSLSVPGRQKSCSLSSDSSCPRLSPDVQHLPTEGDWVHALFSLLLKDFLPCTALWVTGHLLMQLLVKPKTGAALSSVQQTQLIRALEGGRSVMAESAEGTWTDALPMLVSLEWERAFSNLTVSPLQSTTTAVQAWMQAIQIQKLAVDLEVGTRGGKSARAAAIATHAVQRLVALLQIHHGLAAGQVASKLPIAPSSEQHMKRQEVREGMHVKLDSPMSCTVSFSRGSERAVLFAVHGVPSQVSQIGSSARGEQRLTQEDQITLGSISPSVLLASPSGTRGSGVVLSVAPLIGAEAFTDSTHRRWLHVHVRPNARGMLKTIRGSGMGEAMHQLEQQLVDGHWVLSFETSAAAEAALATVKQQATLVKQALKCILSPLL